MKIEALTSSTAKTWCAIRWVARIVNAPMKHRKRPNKNAKAALAAGVSDERGRNRK
ncbi:hypothetical protein KCP75_02340 [Salmonella enterica subsp. enterica]|nr:hypothetical protein KCP75_02340 [Salmonella enterica subsp. enterica]